MAKVRPKQTRWSWSRILLLGVWVVIASLWAIDNPSHWEASDETAMQVAPVNSAQAATPSSPTSSGVSVPIKLNIPTIGVNIPVEAVGISYLGNVGIPHNYDEAGWYSYGPKPGEIGAAIIDGHVNNYFGARAAFTDLKKLQVGDTVIIEDQKNQKWQFVVTEIAAYSYQNFPRQKIFGPYPDARLNLITCAGTWVESKKMYDQRLVVFTKLVGEVAS